MFVYSHARSVSSDRFGLLHAGNEQQVSRGRSCCGRFGPIGSQRAERCLWQRALVQGWQADASRAWKQRRGNKARKGHGHDSIGGMRAACRGQPGGVQQARVAQIAQVEEVRRSYSAGLRLTVLYKLSWRCRGRRQRSAWFLISRQMDFRAAASKGKVGHVSVGAPVLDLWTRVPAEHGPGTSRRRRGGKLAQGKWLIGSFGTCCGGGRVTTVGFRWCPVSGCGGTGIVVEVSFEMWVYCVLCAAKQKGIDRFYVQWFCWNLIVSFTDDVYVVLRASKWTF